MQSLVQTCTNYIKIVEQFCTKQLKNWYKTVPNCKKSDITPNPGSAWASTQSASTFSLCSFLTVFEKKIDSFSRKNGSFEKHFRKRKSITLISVMHPLVEQIHPNEDSPSIY